VSAKIVAFAIVFAVEKEENRKTLIATILIFYALLQN